MPFVVVNRNPQRVNDDTIRLLALKLTGLVAGALTVLGTAGELSSTDIEVRVQDFGPFDINTKDVEIIVWANQYPERLVDLDQRQAWIHNGVRKLLPKDVSGFVWVLLQPGSFGEF